jgi:DNA polymerase-1
VKTLVAFDTETHLIGPAQVAPTMVCISISHEEGQADVIHRRDPACYREMRRLWEDPGVILGGHNAPFDLAVIVAAWPEFLPLMFDLLDRNRVVDSQVRQKLIDIADGCYRGYFDNGVWHEYQYHLKDLAARHHYPVDLDKDTWRLRYAELDGVPVDQWPPGAVEYSRHDAMATRWVIEAQEARVEDGVLEDQHRQSRAHMALHLISAWGIRTDRVMVGRYRRLTEERLEQHRQTLLDRGFIQERKPKKDEDPAAGPYYKKNVKTIQEYAEEKLGDLLVRTPSGKVKMDADCAEEYATVDPVFLAFQEFGSSQTIMKRVEEWEAAVDMPVHTRFDELMETGRTSSSKPNIQNRAAEAPDADPRLGDRECIVPRKGNVFMVSDVPGLELRTIAQTMMYTVGYSKMAEAMRAGHDLHLKVACNILGISEEEGKKRKKDPDDSEIYLARQVGKVYNFGANAGAGWKKIQAEARKKYGLTLSDRDAYRYLEIWKETWPEFKDFFQYIKSLVGGHNAATIYHFGSNRYRGYIPYTVACNTFSQGMGADATKAALYALVKECYVGDGLLRGCRAVNYPHDEYITETPEDDKMDERAREYARVIVTEINKWLPDVPIPEEEMRPIVCRRWSKLAKEVRDPETGRLVPWEWEVAREAGSPGYAQD